MSKNDLKKYLEIAKKAALSAGNFLLHYKKKHLTIQSEIGKDLKISADKEAEEVIIKILQKKSKFPILSEEKGLVKTDGNFKLKWIVDPLDGSLNFLRGIPYSCVSISLFDDKKPLLGVIYDFNRGELFTGITGKFARLNKRKVSVSKTNNAKNAVLTTGFPVATNFSSQALKQYIKHIRMFKKVRLLGSAALSLVYVACGRADAYFEKDIKWWDVAAGLAIVSGAGGVYTIKESKKKNVCVVYASNKYLKNILK